MSRIDQLVAELCPNGVVHYELQDVCTFRRGKGITSKDIIHGDVPVIAGGQKPAYYHNISNREGQTIAIAGSGAYAGFVSFWNRPVFLSDSFSVEPNRGLFITKFVFYFLKNIQDQIYATKKGGGVPHVHGSSIARFVIPAPPLPIQEEIVRILDSFTELEAELEARKKQYQYYLETLIESHKLETLPLEELASFRYGFTDKAQEKGDMRFIRITDIDDSGCLSLNDAHYVNLTTESKKYLLKKGDLLVARTGATFGKTLYVPNDSPMVFASFLIQINLDNMRILNRYYWHFTRSSMYWQQANNLVSKAGQPQFNANVLKKIRVPLPSLHEQERIIDVLDRFDGVCNGFSVGLPAEIGARRKQYEYYRDKLLTFKELEA